MIITTSLWRLLILWLHGSAKNKFVPLVLYIMSDWSITRNILCVIFNVFGLILDMRRTIKLPILKVILRIHDFWNTESGCIEHFMGKILFNFCLCGKVKRDKNALVSKYTAHFQFFDKNIDRFLQKNRLKLNKSEKVYKWTISVCPHYKWSFRACNKNISTENFIFSFRWNEKIIS